jgi:hypothetical protein
MRYANFTDSGLILMHEAVRKAISADSAAIKRGDPPPCMTSETQDWRDHARGLEDEMVKRDVPFIPVRFLENGNDPRVDHRGRSEVHPPHGRDRAQGENKMKYTAD